ncbi:MAG: hypothetical protein [Bacteriophage sp.]|nr:MAG: hypothetical protein [Bacteriophage sp.]
MGWSNLLQMKAVSVSMRACSSLISISAMAGCRATLDASIIELPLQHAMGNIRLPHTHLYALPFVARNLGIGQYDAPACWPCNSWSRI